MRNEVFSSPVAADRIGPGEILQNIIIGLTVSFVALSLGAALGILSGRGAFAGMLSAGLIALITAVLGGTRIQCSGPTAPMSAVTATVVAIAHERLPDLLSADRFVNLTLLLTAGLLLLMALLRLGRFIRLVPNVVISGFMNGIALLIWTDQLRSLFGLGGSAPLGGSLWYNVSTALATVALIFLLAPVARLLVGRSARFLPATLLAIVLASVLAHLARWPIERVRLGSGVESVASFGRMLLEQWPVDWSLPALASAFPFALQLAVLCYLDTLLTALVIDKMTAEPTRQDRELAAQGLATSAVALFGGIPGAQATIRSVLMIKEKASLRLAGIMVGVFVLIEMILFQSWITLIPKAVFAGVLIKVGYDVFDWQPVRLYAKQFSSRRWKLLKNFFSRHDDQRLFVTNRELLMILGTTGITALFDLNIAVAGFTLLFYLHNKVLNRGNPMRDLKPYEETAAFSTQN